MQILVPPSEGKTAAEAGDPVDLDALSFPELTGDRVDLLAALVRLSRTDPDAAASALGLGPTQADEVARNAMLPQAPAGPARAVYSGVLYEALDLHSLSDDASRRADAGIVVTSALWGLLRPADRIPAYRLGGGVTLPGVGGVAAFWRPALRGLLPGLADGLVVDLRSGTYSAFWRPTGEVAERTAVVRVLHERGGRRTVVSHFNKATKGHLLRALLVDGRTPSTPEDLADLLGDLGWRVELTKPARAGQAWTLDVVVTEVATR